MAYNNYFNSSLFEQSIHDQENVLKGNGDSGTSSTIQLLLFDSNKTNIISIIDDLLRSIEHAPRSQKKNSSFREDIRKKLFLLNQSCLDYFKLHGRFPAYRKMIDLLACYVRIECFPFRNKTEADDETEEVEKKILCLLQLMLCDPESKDDFVKSAKFAMSVLVKALSLNSNYNTRECISRMMMKLVNKMNLSAELTQCTALPIHQVISSKFYQIFHENDDCLNYYSDASADSDLDEPITNNSKLRDEFEVMDDFDTFEFEDNILSEFSTPPIISLTDDEKQDDNEINNITERVLENYVSDDETEDIPSALEDYILSKYENLGDPSWQNSCEKTNNFKISSSSGNSIASNGPVDKVANKEKTSTQGNSNSNRFDKTIGTNASLESATITVKSKEQLMEKSWPSNSPAKVVQKRYLKHNDFICLDDDDDDDDCAIVSVTSYNSETIKRENTISNEISRMSLVVDDNAKTPKNSNTSNTISDDADVLIISDDETTESAEISKDIKTNVTLNGTVAIEVSKEKPNVGESAIVHSSRNELPVSPIEVIDISLDEEEDNTSVEVPKSNDTVPDCEETDVLSETAAEASEQRIELTSEEIPQSVEASSTEEVIENFESEGLPTLSESSNVETESTVLFTNETNNNVELFESISEGIENCIDTNKKLNSSKSIPSNKIENSTIGEHVEETPNDSNEVPIEESEAKKTAAEDSQLPILTEAEGENEELTSSSNYIEGPESIVENQESDEELVSSKNCEPKVLTAVDSGSNIVNTNCKNIENIPQIVEEAIVSVVPDVIDDTNIIRELDKEIDKNRDNIELVCEASIEDKSVTTKTSQNEETDYSESNEGENLITKSSKNEEKNALQSVEIETSPIITKISQDDEMPSTDSQSESKEIETIIQNQKILPTEFSEPLEKQANPIVVNVNENIDELIEESKSEEVKELDNISSEKIEIPEIVCSSKVDNASNSTNKSKSRPNKQLTFLSDEEDSQDEPSPVYEEIRPVEEGFSFNGVVPVTKDSEAIIENTPSNSTDTFGKDQLLNESSNIPSEKETSMNSIESDDQNEVSSKNEPGQNLQTDSSTLVEVEEKLENIAVDPPELVIEQNPSPSVDEEKPINQNEVSSKNEHGQNLQTDSSTLVEVEEKLETIAVDPPELVIEQNPSPSVDEEKPINQNEVSSKNEHGQNLQTDSSTLVEVEKKLENIAVDPPELVIEQNSSPSVDEEKPINQNEVSSKNEHSQNLQTDSSTLVEVEEKLENINVIPPELVIEQNPSPSVVEEKPINQNEVSSKNEHGQNLQTDSSTLVEVEEKLENIAVIPTSVDEEKPINYCINQSKPDVTESTQESVDVPDKILEISEVKEQLQPSIVREIEDVSFNAKIIDTQLQGAENNTPLDEGNNELEYGPVNLSTNSKDVLDLSTSAYLDNKLLKPLDCVDSDVISTASEDGLIIDEDAPGSPANEGDTDSPTELSDSLPTSGDKLDNSAFTFPEIHSLDILADAADQREYLNVESVQKRKRGRRPKSAGKNANTTKRVTRSTRSVKSLSPKKDLVNNVPPAEMPLKGEKKNKSKKDLSMPSLVDTEEKLDLTLPKKKKSSQDVATVKPNNFIGILDENEPLINLLTPRKQTKIENEPKKRGRKPRKSVDCKSSENEDVEIDGKSKQKLNVNKSKLEIGKNEPKLNVNNKIKTTLNMPEPSKAKKRSTSMGPQVKIIPEITEKVSQKSKKNSFEDQLLDVTELKKNKKHQSSKSEEKKLEMNEKKDKPGRPRSKKREETPKLEEKKPESVWSKSKFVKRSSRASLNLKKENQKVVKSKESIHITDTNRSDAIDKDPTEKAKIAKVQPKEIKAEQTARNAIKNKENKHIPERNFVINHEDDLKQKLKRVKAEIKKEPNKRKLRRGGREIDESTRNEIKKTLDDLFKVDDTVKYEKKNIVDSKPSLHVDNSKNEVGKVTAISTTNNIIVSPPIINFQRQTSESSTPPKKRKYLFEETPLHPKKRRSYTMNDVDSEPIKKDEPIVIEAVNKNVVSYSTDAKIVDESIVEKTEVKSNETTITTVDVSEDIQLCEVKTDSPTEFNPSPNDESIVPEDCIAKTMHPVVKDTEEIDLNTKENVAILDDQEEIVESSEKTLELEAVVITEPNSEQSIAEPIDLKENISFEKSVDNELLLDKEKQDIDVHSESTTIDKSSTDKVIEPLQENVPIQNIHNDALESDNEIPTELPEQETITKENAPVENTITEEITAEKSGPDSAEIGENIPIEKDTIIEASTNNEETIRENSIPEPEIKEDTPLETVTNPDTIAPKEMDVSEEVLEEYLPSNNHLVEELIADVEVKDEISIEKTSDHGLHCEMEETISVKPFLDTEEPMVAEESINVEEIAQKIEVTREESATNEVPVEKSISEEAITEKDLINEELESEINDNATDEEPIKDTMQVVEESINSEPRIMDVEIDQNITISNKKSEENQSEKPALEFGENILDNVSGVEDPKLPSEVLPPAKDMIVDAINITETAEGDDASKKENDQEKQEVPNSIKEISEETMNMDEDVAICGANQSKEVITVQDEIPEKIEEEKVADKESESIVEEITESIEHREAECLANEKTEHITEKIDEHRTTEIKNVAAIEYEEMNTCKQSIAEDMQETEKDEILENHEMDVVCETETVEESHTKTQELCTSPVETIEIENGLDIEESIEHIEQSDSTEQSFNLQSITEENPIDILEPEEEPILTIETEAKSEVDMQENAVESEKLVELTTKENETESSEDIESPKNAVAEKETEGENMLEKDAASEMAPILVPEGVTEEQETLKYSAFEEQEVGPEELIAIENLEKEKISNNIEENQIMAQDVALELSTGEDSIEASSKSDSSILTDTLGSNESSVTDSTQSEHAEEKSLSRSLTDDDNIEENQLIPQDVALELSTGEGSIEASSKSDSFILTDTLDSNESSVTDSTQLEHAEEESLSRSLTDDDKVTQDDPVLENISNDHACVEDDSNSKIDADTKHIAKDDSNLKDTPSAECGIEDIPTTSVSNEKSITEDILATDGRAEENDLPIESIPLESNESAIEKGISEDSDEFDETLDHEVSSNEERTLLESSDEDISENMSGSTFKDDSCISTNNISTDSQEETQINNENSIGHEAKIMSEGLGFDSNLETESIIPSSNYLDENDVEDSNAKKSDEVVKVPYIENTLEDNTNEENEDIGVEKVSEELIDPEVNLADDFVEKTQNVVVLERKESYVENTESEVTIQLDQNQLVRERMQHKKPVVRIVQDILISPKKVDQKEEAFLEETITESKQRTTGKRKYGKFDEFVSESLAKKPKVIVEKIAQYDAHNTIYSYGKVNTIENFNEEPNLEYGSSINEVIVNTTELDKSISDGDQSHISIGDQTLTNNLIYLPDIDEQQEEVETSHLNEVILNTSSDNDNLNSGNKNIGNHAPIILSLPGIDGQPAVQYPIFDIADINFDPMKTVPTFVEGQSDKCNLLHDITNKTPVEENKQFEVASMHIPGVISAHPSANVDIQAANISKQISENVTYITNEMDNIQKPNVHFMYTIDHTSDVGGPLLSGKCVNSSLKESMIVKDVITKDNQIRNAQNDLDNSPTGSESMFNLTEENNIDVSGLEGEILALFKHCDLSNLEPFCEKNYQANERMYIIQENPDLPQMFLEEETPNLDHQYEANPHLWFAEDTERMNTGAEKANKTNEFSQLDMMNLPINEVSIPLESEITMPSYNLEEIPKEPNLETSNVEGVTYETIKNAIESSIAEAKANIDSSQTENHEARTVIPEKRKSLSNVSFPAFSTPKPINKSNEHAKHDEISECSHVKLPRKSSTPKKNVECVGDAQTSSSKGIVSQRLIKTLKESLHPKLTPEGNQATSSNAPSGDSSLPKKKDSSLTIGNRTGIVEGPSTSRGVTKQSAETQTKAAEISVSTSFAINSILNLADQQAKFPMTNCSLNDFVSDENPAPPPAIASTSTWRPTSPKSSATQTPNLPTTPAAQHRHVKRVVDVTAHPTSFSADKKRSPFDIKIPLEKPRTEVVSRNSISSSPNSSGSSCSSIVSSCSNTRTSPSTSRKSNGNVPPKPSQHASSSKDNIDASYPVRKNTRTPVSAPKKKNQDSPVSTTKPTISNSSQPKVDSSAEIMKNIPSSLSEQIKAASTNRYDDKRPVKRLKEEPNILNSKLGISGPVATTASLKEAASKQKFLDDFQEPNYFENKYDEIKRRSELKSRENIYKQPPWSPNVLNKSKRKKKENEVVTSKKPKTSHYEIVPGSKDSSPKCVESKESESPFPDLPKLSPSESSKHTPKESDQLFDRLYEEYQQGRTQKPTDKISKDQMKLNISSKLNESVQSVNMKDDKHKEIKVCKVMPVRRSNPTSSNQTHGLVPATQIPRQQSPSSDSRRYSGAESRSSTSDNNSDWSHHSTHRSSQPSSSSRNRSSRRPSSTSSKNSSSRSSSSRHSSESRNGVLICSVRCGPNEDDADDWRSRVEKLIPSLQDIRNIFFVPPIPIKK